MIIKILKSKNILTLLILLSILSLIFFYFSFYKFYSIYFEKKWQLIGNDIETKNLEIVKKLDKGKIFFEEKEYIFQKLSLEKNGFTYDEDYFYRPFGYIEIFDERLIFAHYDGTFYFSNKIEEIKLGKFELTKFEVNNFDYKFNINDDDPYRTIVIRDILVHEDNLFVVINGRKKASDEEYSFRTTVLKSKINLKNNNLNFKKFFEPKENITGIVGNHSHTGGRIIKYKNNDFLLAVPDHSLMDDYELLTKKVNAKKFTIGKVLKINSEGHEIFTYGHRNPQGLYYDSKKNYVFQTEHGPTGGDEINFLKKGGHYGWPIATYGARIYGLNKVRSHRNNGFKEPLAYWWPRNCGISQIIKIDEKFNSNWKKYNLLNACLSGSGANQGYSIYRWEFKEENKKLIKKNQYHIGDRIRDLIYSKKHNTIFLVLENQKSIALIYK